MSDLCRQKYAQDNMRVAGAVSFLKNLAKGGLDCYNQAIASRQNRMQTGGGAAAEVLPMITRVWHGMVPEALGDEYQDYLYATGLPGLKSTAGNLGVIILRRTENGIVHFLFTSFWESLEAISRFAGPDVEKARYYPEDEKFLIELEPNVTHYEVVAGQEMIAN